MKHIALTDNYAGVVLCGISRSDAEAKGDGIMNINEDYQIKEITCRKCKHLWKINNNEATDPKNRQ